MSESKSKVKSISFRDEYMKEYEYIKSIGNASDYICKLIRADLERGNGNNLKELIIEVLNELSINSNELNPTTQETPEELTELVNDIVDF